MSIDPSDPETFENLGNDDSTESDVEAPEADAADQHRDLVPHRDDQPPSDELVEANEADRAEQARVVEVNEEDYR
ncbi:hypothetical protein [Streptomyces cucumeris]|uniref:hypothetical protein n=1 Tax=Streptomyces cucumeris TaxID=2962890 RepID=UPI0020C8D685|nr:hypothetical protein [Streptomyces sp. NEAU-Y11]MCP9206243.1 hypothetical protein [Streptomyces sp. NEAU-Y11]